MTYILHVEAGTEKLQNLLGRLSANPSRLSTHWTETLGLTEAIEAGIDEIDYGWFIDDLQNAKIEKIDKSHFVIKFNDRMNLSTPTVLETLSRTNNRLGHPHLKFACYLQQNGAITPLDSKQAPIHYEPTH